MPGPRRRHVERLVARLLCAVFAIVGLLPLGLAIAVRTSFVRSRIEREVTAVLARELDVTASFHVELAIVPPAVRVTDLVVPANDGGEPALAIGSVEVAPRIFSLLAGKLDAGAVDVERPRARAVIDHGALTNVAYRLPPPSGEKSPPPTTAPFRTLSITDATIDVTAVEPGVHAVVRDLDLDVIAGEGLSFGAAIRAASAAIDRRRRDEHGADAIDEDAICGLDARLEVAPDRVLVRRLELRTRLDDDPNAGTRPTCEGDISAENRLDLDLAHFRVSPREGALPSLDGHLRAAVPLRAIGRALPSAPALNGSAVIDVDASWDGVAPLPTVHGELHGRDLMLLHERSLSRTLDGQIAIEDGDVKLPHATSDYGDASVTITNAVVGVTKPGIPIDVELVDVKDLRFPGLMRDIGITPRTHVQWIFDVGQIRHFKGYVVDPVRHGPMLLGDIRAETRDFEVFDRAVVDPARRHLIGVHRATARGKFGIEPNGAVFRNMTADFGKSHADVPTVFIGFVDAVEVVASDRTHVDLADISPIADVRIAGVADASCHVFGTQGSPRLTAKAGVKDFKLADMPLADTAELEAKFEPFVVESTKLHATKGKSAYDVSKLRLDVNGPGVTVDVEGGGKGFDFRDLLAMLRFDQDPRFTEIEGSADAKISFRYERGTPLDRCGDGLFDVRAEATLGPMDVYGERYDGGAGEGRFLWFDPAANERGMDASISSFVVRKGRGTIVGAGSIKPGAELRGHFVASDIPIAKVDSFGPIARGIDGAINATGELTGYADAFGADAKVTMTPLRVGQKKLGASAFDVHLVPAPRSPPIPGKFSRCGAPITSGFDLKAYARDEPKGAFHLDGALFGGQIALRDVAITQQREKVLSGTLAFDGADIGAAGQLVPALALADAPPSGRLSGTLAIASMPFEHLDETAAKVTLTELAAKQGARTVVLRKSGAEAAATIATAGGDVALAPMTLDVADGSGLAATIDVRGKVHDLAGEQRLDADVSVQPIDLAALAALMPRVDSASGRLEASFHVGGTAAKPVPRGELRLAGGSLSVRGFPASLEDVNLVAKVDERELSIDQATARASGGRLTLSVRAPLEGLTPGRVTAKLDASDVHLDLADGVATAIDASIRASWQPPTLDDPTPHKALVEGDVAVKSFLYSRPIGVSGNLDSLAKTARRTAVSVYDPEDDTVEFDIAIRPERPLQFRNNLVDAQVSLDSDALVLHGTNQRMGLEGALRVDKGGHLRLRDNEFEIRQGTIRFEDRTRIAPRVDLTATTDYRRYTTSTSAPTAGGGTAAASAGGSWRFTLHAHGDADDLKVDLSSEPNLAPEDIVLMLTIGLTRAELDQLQAANVGGAAALEALSALSGASSAVRTAVPIIDDFRLGSAYSPRTGRTEPTVTVGKRISADVRANVVTGLTDNRDVRSNVEWTLTPATSILGNYDNLNDVTSQGLGNLGADFRVRLEF